jgi:hypothetical protein
MCTVLPIQGWPCFVTCDYTPPPPHLDNFADFFLYPPPPFFALWWAMSFCPFLRPLGPPLLANFASFLQICAVFFRAERAKTRPCLSCALYSRVSVSRLVATDSFVSWNCKLRNIKIQIFKTTFLCLNIDVFGLGLRKILVVCTEHINFFFNFFFPTYLPLIDPNFWFWLEYWRQNLSTVQLMSKLPLPPLPPPPVFIIEELC